MRPRLSILSLGAIVATCFTAAPAHAATFNYPGAAPCNTTLQACIDGVASGSTIAIATNAPIMISADLLIENKSLTLRPKAGFEPLLRGTNLLDPYRLVMRAGSGAPATNMQVIGIATEEMRVEMDATDNDTSPHRFLFKDSSISNDLDHNNTAGIALDLRSPANAVVLNNTIRSNGQLIQVWHNSDLGPTYARVEANRLDSAETAFAYTGIENRADESSPATSDLFNNVVLDTAGCNCGGPAGISTLATTGADLRTNIVGNTIHDVDEGYPGIDVRSSMPSTHVVKIFNNTISNATGGALRFQAATAGLSIRNGYNNLFNSPGSDLGGYALGPHTTTVKPRFKNASSGNFKLKATSPLIDRGLTCQPGGLGRMDAGGHFRFVAPRVDIGAFEFGSKKAPPRGKNVFGTASGDTLRGTGGVDIICGLGGNDVIRGRRGADWLEAGRGHDRTYGQAGADVVRAGKGKKDLASGGRGDDKLVTKDGGRADIARGGKGDDTCKTDKRDRRFSC